MPWTSSVQAARTAAAAAAAVTTTRRRRSPQAGAAAAARVGGPARVDPASGAEGADGEGRREAAEALGGAEA